MRTLRCLTIVTLTAASMLSAAVCAATLQISPVMVELRPEENASGITLRNPGDHLLYGQIRVFRWDEATGEDSLTASQELFASPPLIEIPPHSDQLVRLVRSSAVPVPAEQSFRILIDELPSPDEMPSGGVTIRLRYSVPVFIEPAGAAGTPMLSWYLSKNPQGWTIRVENTGVRRAQIAAAELVDSADRSYVINKGLLGYALAGCTRQWSISLPADVDLHGTIKIRAIVNAQRMETIVTLQPAR